MSTIQNEEGKNLVEHSVPLLRNVNYLLLWSGQTISLIGSNISQLALPLLVLGVTHSPAQAGIVGALHALPYPLFSLPAGALIDRWDRKKTMIFCDSGRALLMASIPLTLVFGRLTLLQLCLIALLEGTLFVFFNIAQTACLPLVVSKEQLPLATAQDQAMISTSYLIGPLLGGSIYSLGRAFPFVTDALSYAISVFSLLCIKIKFQNERPGVRSKLHEEIIEGLMWLWGQPLIRFMALLTGGTNVLAGESLIVIIIAQQQHASAALVGLILGIGGVGAIAGSFLGPIIQKRFSFGQAIIATCWLCALFTACYAVVPTPFALGVVVAASFTVAPIYNVVQISRRLALIPDELQGRVNSVFRLIAFSSVPLGMALTGFLLQWLGPMLTALIYSLWLAILALITTLNAHVRREA